MDWNGMNEENKTEIPRDLAADWPRSFYKETDAMKRKAILDAAIAAGMDQEEAALRTLMWEKRYPQMSKSTSQRRDTFLQMWMELHFIAQKTGKLFTEKSNRRSLEQCMHEMGYTEMCDRGEQACEILQDEICHMAILYASLCQSDHNYGSVILGIGKMKDETLVAKIAKDYAEVAYFVPEYYKDTYNLDLWRKAVTEGFLQAFPYKESELDEAIEAVRKRMK